jgi:hypothetical protein
MAPWWRSRSATSARAVRVHGEIDVDAAALLSYLDNAQRVRRRDVSVSDLVRHAVEYAVASVPGLHEEAVEVVEAADFGRATATGLDDALLVAFGAIVERPIVVAGRVVARPVLTLTVSHALDRASDDIAHFVVALRAFLSHPAEFAVTAWEPREAPAGT